MQDVAQQAFAENIPQLRLAVALISEFVSENILDPHWGFQNTFAGAVHYAETPEDFQQLISRLIETLDIMGFSEARLRELDAKLAEHDIPPIASLCLFN
jgi:hypothetical protein